MFASMCAICVCQQLEASNAWPPKPLISNVVVRQPAFELWNMLRFSWNWCHRRITWPTNCAKGFVSNFSATDACGCVACVEDSSWNIFDFIVIAVSVIDVCAVFCTMFDSYVLVPPNKEHPRHGFWTISRTITFYISGNGNLCREFCGAFLRQSFLCLPARRSDMCQIQLQSERETKRWSYGQPRI